MSTADHPDDTAGAAPTDNPIQVISLAPWFDGDAEQQAAVAAAVDESLRQAGFLVVVDHGVDTTLPARLRAEADAFFTRPEDEKLPYRVAQLGDLGWVPYGLEANGYIFGEDTPPDMKESFVVGMAHLGDREPVGPNVWPAEHPAMRDLVGEYLEQVERLHMELLRILAMALGLDDLEFFVDQESQAHNVLNVNWYPPLVRTGAVQDDQYRIGPHTDFGSITILDRQPGTGCLQVQDAAGTWQDAAFVADSLTINVGDLLEMWTGGRWRSSRHRVLPPSDAAPDEALMSLVYFCEPDLDTVVRPIVDGDEFEPVLTSAFMQAKIDQITVT